MVKFYFIHKLKRAISIIILLKYVSWCLFFLFQGQAIEMAVTRRQNFYLLFEILCWYMVTKIITMLSDIAEKFVIEFYKNKELKLQWHYLFPLVIYKDNENKSDDINLLFYDYIPKLFDLETSIIANTYSFLIIASISLSFLVFNKFYYGVYILLAIFILNHINKNIFVSKIEEYERRVESGKLKVMKWVAQFFDSYKEIYHAWNNHQIISWKESVYLDYYNNKSKNIFLYLYRDLFSQVLVEIPFLINTALVITAVFYNYISISQMFVWVGVSQFMINASNAYMNNRLKDKNRLGLSEKIKDTLSNFEITKMNFKLMLVRDMSNNIAEITLRDGTNNTLGLNPGIYSIKGSNGSGKSTLLNIVTGYDRKSEIQNNPQFEMLLRHIDIFSTRFMSRDPVIFDDLRDFTAQVCGPDYVHNKNWYHIISHNVSKILIDDLANRWLRAFKDLENKYYNRPDRILSSGEKIVLSFMRILSSWQDDVCLLIIDECDVFLDRDKKELFAETLEFLSLSVAVYIVRHGEKEGTINTEFSSREECISI